MIMTNHSGEAAPPRHFGSVLLAALRTACAIAALSLLSGVAQGQIFVTISGSNVNQGIIGAYNFDGTAINASLVSGINSPGSIVVSGNGSLLVARSGDIQIGEYTTSGATLNSALITPVNYPGQLAVSEDGARLFVSTTNFNSLDGRITEYTTAGATVGPVLAGLGRLTTLAVAGDNLYFANNGPLSVYTTGGGLVTTSLLPGINVKSVAISGSDMFVAYDNKIGHYLITGESVNDSLITGLPDGVSGISIVGDSLFLLNSTFGTIGQYTTSGATVNASLITGLGGTAYSFTTVGSAIPEPSTYVSIIGSVVLVAAILARRRKRLL
jgi:hypothetical protein